MLASPSTHSSPIINITPTLVITSHGIWRDPDDSFELPIGINMVKATQIGVVNILDQKVSNSIPKLVEDANAPVNHKKVVVHVIHIQLEKENLKKVQKLENLEKVLKLENQKKRLLSA